MRRRRFLLFSLVASLGLLLALGSPSEGNAGGAPNNSATQGCTCHAAAPEPMVQVTLEGLPGGAAPTAVAGTTYNLTLKVGGDPPLPAPVGANAGGFALEASPDPAAVAPADDLTQLRAGKMLTHTAKGNDQREWRFAWTPSGNATNVTFSFAGNAVNGDRLNDDFDVWNLGQLAVAVERPAPPPTSEPPPTTDADTRSPALLVVLGAAAAALLVLRRRRA